MRVDLINLELQELEEFICGIGEKKYRAKQVFEWVHKGVCDFDDMTNLSLSLRDKLKEVATVCKEDIVEKLESKIDDTVKYLLRLPDGNVVESVLMKYKHGYSVCVSSQVGCRMGCRFCASTGIGFVRNLTAGEILAEVLTIQKDLGERISNIVMMGIGEPFDNYDNVLKFLRLVNDKNGLNVGSRHISISTCGIVPKILDFAKKNLQVTLSVSLHSADDRVRESMMPINKKYKIKELIDACKEYINMTNRRLTFEYALVREVNDSDEDAIDLVRLVKGMMCHINLIPVNEHEGSSYRKSYDERVERFKNILLKKGVNATVRRELGSDIKAACGQLRRSKL